MTDSTLTDLAALEEWSKLSYHGFVYSLVNHMKGEISKTRAVAEYLSNQNEIMSIPLVELESHQEFRRLPEFKSSEKLQKDAERMENKTIAYLVEIILTSTEDAMIWLNTALACAQEKGEG